jgi:hypothetical protein
VKLHLNVQLTTAVLFSPGGRRLSLRCPTLRQHAWLWFTKPSKRGGKPNLQQILTHVIFSTRTNTYIIIRDTFLLLQLRTYNIALNSWRVSRLAHTNKLRLSETIGIVKHVWNGMVGEGEINTSIKSVAFNSLLLFFDRPLEFYVVKCFVGNSSALSNIIYLQTPTIL